MIFREVIADVFFRTMRSADGAVGGMGLGDGGGKSVSAYSGPMGKPAPNMDSVACRCSKGSCREIKSARGLMREGGGRSGATSAAAKRSLTR